MTLRRFTPARRPRLPSARVDGRWTMETPKHQARVGRLVLLSAALIVTLALLPGAVRAAPGADPEYPADGCSDPNIDCGSGSLESGVLSESWDAYEYSPGTCRTRWARATRRNLAYMVVSGNTEGARWGC